MTQANVQVVDHTNRISDNGSDHLKRSLQRAEENLKQVSAREAKHIDTIAELRARLEATEKAQQQLGAEKVRLETDLARVRKERGNENQVATAREQDLETQLEILQEKLEEVTAESVDQKAALRKLEGEIQAANLLMADAANNVKASNEAVAKLTLALENSKKTLEAANKRAVNFRSWKTWALGTTAVAAGAGLCYGALWLFGDD